jgi:hypothetical protein
MTDFVLAVLKLGMILLKNYKRKIVGFEVLTAVSTKMDVFWAVAPCSLIEVYQCFRGPCCLHHQGDEYCTAVQPRRKPSDGKLQNSCMKHGEHTSNNNLYNLKLFPAPYCHSSNRERHGWTSVVFTCTSPPVCACFIYQSK